MICPHCKTVNDDENSFCVNCGATIAFAGPRSVVTQFSQRPVFEKAEAGGTLFQGELHDGPAKKKGWAVKALLIVVPILFLAGSAVFAAIYFLTERPIPDALPSHLGMFYRNADRTSLSELRRIDTSNLWDARKTILEDGAVSVVDEQPEFIQYADVTEPSATELRIVSIDSIKDDGSLKEIEFQAFLIDGKPAMKRLRPPRPLAVGKYALLRTDGYFDEGKHRLWAFEIRNAQRKELGDTATDRAIALKPKPPPTPPPAGNPNVQPVAAQPRPVPVQPPGSRAAYCNSTNVVVRSSPSLSARKINGLRKGQRVYVLSFSTNTDSWGGVQSNWAYIETESGKRGWVFSPFISY